MSKRCNIWSTKISFLISSSGKLKTCRNLKWNFFSSCLQITVITVWLLIVFTEHNLLHFLGNVHLLKYYPVKVPQYCFTLHGKPYFLFPDVLKRWSFQKKSWGNMIFLVLSGKIMFLFPENMIWHLRRKMKDDLSQKNTRKYDIFFKLS